MELQFLNWLQTFRAPWLDSLMIIVTSMGNGGIFWISCAIILLLFPKTRKMGAAIAISLALESICCNLILKPLVARPRPFDINKAVSLLIARPKDYSFPSGHAGAAYAATSALFFEKSRLWVPSGVLAVLIAFSRMYLYVHYPTDVLAGALIGIMFGWLGTFVANKLFALRNQAQNS